MPEHSMINTMIGIHAHLEVINEYWDFVNSGEVPAHIRSALHGAEVTLSIVALWYQAKCEENSHGTNNQESVAQQPEAHAEANPEESRWSACGCRIPN